MDEKLPQVSDEAKIMAAIGNVCLQWARLEIGLLGILNVIEGIPHEKGEIIFGGLDMQPRVNMAINLARHAKLPPPILKRLTNVRKAIQGGLSDRRNQIVHGAHREMENGSTTLTMVRWSGARKTQKFTALDIAALATEIFELGNECWSIMDAYGAWKFGAHVDKDLSDTVG